MAWTFPGSSKPFATWGASPINACETTQGSYVGVGLARRMVPEVHM
jgi:hypothetical protein